MKEKVKKEYKEMEELEKKLNCHILCSFLGMVKNTNQGYGKENTEAVKYQPNSSVDRLYLPKSECSRAEWR